MMKFSVATPTRNALPLLRRCVGSVRGQAGVDHEHLIQDACSVDGTVEWMGAQAGLDFRSEPDRGMYDAIQRAWGRAGGDIVSWLNADEQYLPGTLAKVEAIFRARPDVEVVFGDFIVCDRHGDPVAVRREIPFRARYVRNGFLYAASCTLFFRRSLLEKGWLGFDTTLRYAADKDLMLNLARRGVKIHHVRDILALFGIDGSNLSGQEGMRKEAEEVRRRHGAFKSPLLREAVFAGRRFERLARGAYISKPVNYLFAVDEVPTYRRVGPCAVGGRYSLDEVGKNDSGR